MKKQIRTSIAFAVAVQLASLGAQAAPLNTLPLDVAVVGPGGDVLVYYKDGGDIVVRNCGSNYPIIKKRSDCVTVGDENRVPTVAFKRALETGFMIHDADKLKPLTEEEVKSFRNSDPARLKNLEAQQKEVDAKLAQIHAFIQNYGKDLEDTTKLLAQVRKELTSAQKGGDAIKKVNAVIQDIVDKKIASTEITPVSFAKASDQAVYMLLKQFDASRAECGIDEILNGTYPSSPSGPLNESAPKALPASGRLENFFITNAQAANTITVDQRVKDCSKVKGATKTTSKGVRWDLVSRKRDRSTGKFYEVWKDSKSGLLWGDRLNSTYTHYNAVELGLNGKVVAEKACASEEGKRASTNLSGKTFGLPVIEEYEQAEKNGVREVLPNMSNYFFWSASLSPDYSDDARVFNGYYGYSGYVFRDNYYSVRCVAR